MTSNEENVGVLIDAWKLMTGRLPDGTITHSRGVATMFGNVPLPFLNVSVPDRPLPTAHELRAALAVARERAGACRYASLVALCEPWAPADWQRVAEEEGFDLALNMTGMAAERLLPPRRPPADIELRRVLDEATARDLALINAAAYGMPPEMFECICNMRLWHADSFAYVGYADGRAVTSAAALPVAGTMYVAFVATLPEAHGKGYAETAMRHVIEQARHAMGAMRITLHASDMGRPLYSAMGFEPGARVVLLEVPRSLP